MKALSADWDTWYPSTYTGSTDDKINGFLSDRGYTGSLDDKLFKYMRDCGYAGGLSDMLYQYRGRNLVGAAPVLDLNFAGMSSALPSWATFTRATSENAFNASGILTSFASGAPAFAYDPVSHVALGTAWFGQITNKCTNFNANPTDLTGVTKGGDAASTLTVVDDAVALTAAGLSGVCTSGKVYKLDNSAGTGVANAFFVGAAGNTNAHSLSLYVRGSGQVHTRLATQGGPSYTALTTGYVRLIAANQTPSATTNNMGVEVQAGATCYFILNQLEENTFATPVIVVAGAAATRNTDVGTVSLNVTNIPANPVGLAFGFAGRTAAGKGSDNQWLLNINDGTANNRFGVFRAVTSGDITAFLVAGGTTQFNKVIYSASPDNTDIKGYFTAQAGNMAAQVIGQAQQTQASGSMPTGLTTISLGANFNAISLWNSTIKHIPIYGRFMPPAQMASIAAGL